MLRPWGPRSLRGSRPSTHCHSPPLPVPTVRSQRRACCAAAGSSQPSSTGRTPSGSPLVRSCGLWATEKDEHGGAAKTAWYRPSRTHPTTVSATA
eukprot:1997217-Pleurochrysis_carterae.AAC.1